MKNRKVASSHSVPACSLLIFYISSSCSSRGEETQFVIQLLNVTKSQNLSLVWYLLHQSGYGSCDLVTFRTNLSSLLTPSYSICNGVEETGKNWKPSLKKEKWKIQSNIIYLSIVKKILTLKRQLFWKWRIFARNVDFLS